MKGYYSAFLLLFLLTKPTIGTGAWIHDLIHYSNIKALASSTDDATLEHLECAPGLSHVLGYLIIYCCHLLQGSVI